MKEHISIWSRLSRSSAGPGPSSWISALLNTMNVSKPPTKCLKNSVRFSLYHVNFIFFIRLLLCFQISESPLITREAGDSSESYNRQVCARITARHNEPLHDLSVGLCKDFSDDIHIHHHNFGNELVVEITSPQLQGRALSLASLESRPHMCSIHTSHKGTIPLTHIFPGQFRYCSSPHRSSASRILVSQSTPHHHFWRHSWVQWLRHLYYLMVCLTFLSFVWATYTSTHLLAAISALTFSRSSPTTTFLSN